MSYEWSAVLSGSIWLAIQRLDAVSGADGITLSVLPSGHFSSSGELNAKLRTD